MENPLSSRMQGIKNQYQQELQARNLEQSTISLYGYVIHYVLLCIEEGSLDLADADIPEAQRIVGYFNGRCNATSMGTIVPIIRDILKFLYKTNHIRQNLAGSIMAPNHSRNQAKGYILPEDEKRLVESFASMNKRDKAILLLTIETGLRESDILGMQLAQVDWKTDKITITQRKTGHLLILPLLPDVGNALASYILDERPTPAPGSEGYIFLRRQAPYHRVSSVYTLVRKYMESSNIQPVNTNKAGGLHLLRHSLIYNLLRNQVPDYTITKVLGHVRKESDKPYLSLDEKMLRECAMPIPSPESVVGGLLK
jgi:site-specific recombinase XerD